MTDCPCCSKLAYDECCGPFISGDRQATTAEALMRSRYTAFTNGAIDYIVDTIHPKKRDPGDRESAKNWSESSEWNNLEIVSTEKGKEGDSKGVVEFIARYTQNGEKEEHHESAKFEKVNGRWYFVDGRLVGKEPYVRPEPKIGRNDPCPCGSNKKYKKCCGK